MNKILILLFIPFICFGQLKFLPKKSKGDCVVEHTYYSLSYVEKHEQAEWVHYKLNPKMVLTNEINRKKFKTDRNYYQDRTCKSKSAHKDDIKFSVDSLERGHLAPAADMKIDSISVREAAYMSNISPQKKDFNRREWYELEKHVRSLAKENELYITTGGVLSCDLDSIGKKNKVSVPKLFYKIIYDDKNKRMTAYLMPNRKLHSSFENHIVTVDLIETLTGIDFYHQLEDELEEKLESAKNGLTSN